MDRYLSDAFINKGTAYTHDERRRLGLEGLLPPRVESLQAQAARVVENVRGKASPLEKYRYLSAVRADNDTLFYRVVLDHLEETAPDHLHADSRSGVPRVEPNLRAAPRAVHLGGAAPRPHRGAACGIGRALASASSS